MKTVRRKRRRSVEAVFTKQIDNHDVRTRGQRIDGLRRKVDRNLLQNAPLIERIAVRERRCREVGQVRDDDTRRGRALADAIDQRRHLDPKLTYLLVDVRTRIAVRRAADRAGDNVGVVASGEDGHDG
jgi:hypothetical protein